ncbi:hypothetical protein L3X38_016102 [Prunus dulcis]|uniref:O-fucosyltransferase family protein n=1 Tax=Prunus dulcis TaxID=3755 RepID=A0AAD4Z9H4_PRUDU|nr:hypothetical protein L3X38_016102 [Prunus dulcis]
MVPYLNSRPSPPSSLLLLLLLPSPPVLVPQFDRLKKQSTDVKTYLLTAISGGLNQQRRGIIDALVAAYILNATLLVLKLGQKLFWKDSSNFDEIFDNRLVPVLNKNIGVQLTKFDYRLSNKLDSNLQKLRCRANYRALKFNDLINEMGKTLVDRMRMKSKHFIALHLRLVAFNLGYLPGGDKTIIRVRNNTEQGIGSCKKDRGAWRQATLTRYEVNINHFQGKVLHSVRVSDPGLLLKPDEPNLIIMAKPAGGPSKRDQHAGMDED